MHGMIILGPAGSGKTTLGKFVADKMEIAFLDIDEYIWRNDTEKPYSVMYSKEEKISNLMEAVQKAKEFVMAGSMSSFHEYFDPMFLLAVYLTADAKVRVKRIHEREQKEFGDRILPGGDMYEEHQQFLNDAANYDGNAASCNKSQHELWLNQIGCPDAETQWRRFTGKERKSNCRNISADIFGGKKRCRSELQMKMTWKR